MLFMLIGRFRRDEKSPEKEPHHDSDASGLHYIGSWVEANLGRAFQVVECEDPTLLQRWAARWRHLVDFEIVPIVPSTQTVASLAALIEKRY